MQVNNLLAEQKRYVEQLAAAQEAAAKSAQAAAEAAANKAEAEAEKAKRKAEQDANEAARIADQLHDAQLRYNLQIADTPGKIALMKAELAKTTVGSAEYFGILTQIDSLQKQYNAELEKGASGLAAMGAGGSDALAGLKTDMESLTAAIPPGGGNLKSALEEAFAPVGPATESVKKLGDSLSALGVTIGTLIGIDFKSWLEGNKQATDTTGWDHYGIVVAANTATAQQNATLAAEAMEKSATDTDLTLRQMQSNAKVIMDIWHGDWDQFWIDWAENVRLGNEAANRYQGEGEETWATRFGAWLANIKKDTNQFIIDQFAAFGQWLIDMNESIDGMAEAFEKSGKALLGKFWDGLKSKWGEISSWFTTSLAGLRAQLPFSEPKDPNSPLRGLKQSGMALVDMVQSGISAASLDVSPLANSLLPQGVTSQATTNMGPFSQTLIFYGKVEPETVTKAAESGTRKMLQSMGIINS